MDNCTRFYIDGDWVEPAEPGATVAAVNPATEEPTALVALGSAADVDRAVAAARRAFPAFAETSREERLALLRRIVDAYKARYEDIAAAISCEVGAPLAMARNAQAAMGIAHLKQTIAVLSAYAFEKEAGSSLIVREPVGVVGLITPWNWPMNQIACKVAPAIAAGCTIVLKPSELAPVSARIFAEALDAAGVPKGVFNLVQGTGDPVGSAIAAHPDIDMVSFTGSTRAGILVAKAAADTVKRVHQELGGKSANIILPDADLRRAVTGGAHGCFHNSGQSCNAPTRMLVHESQYEEAVEHAAAVARKLKVGDPAAADTTLGPVIGAGQFDRIQGLIATGVAEGARLAAGGPGRPDGLERGFFVRPTVFADVTPEMTVAREEIFGPVLAILKYRDEDEAVAIANDSPYGLSGYVSSGDPERARRVARRLRTGSVHLNGALPDLAAPFGGYKRSGNGREWGEAGFEEFLETKAILGAVPAANGRETAS